MWSPLNPYRKGKTQMNVSAAGLWLHHNGIIEWISRMCPKCTRASASD